MSFGELTVAALYSLKSRLGVVTAGDAGKNVDLALLEHVKLGLGNDLNVGDGLDGGSAADVVAGILLVELKGGGVRRSVVVCYIVRTGVRDLGVPLKVRHDLGSGLVGLFALNGGLCIESVVKAALFGGGINNDVARAAEPGRWERTKR